MATDPVSDARAKLSQFVTNLESVLERALHEPALFPEFYDELKASFAETRPLWSALRGAISNVSETELRRHGLIGATLDLELAVFDADRAALEEEWHRLEEGEGFWARFYARVRGLPLAKLVSMAQEMVRSAAVAAIRTRLWRMLKSGDIVLGSLQGALGPAAVGVGLLKEFKGMVEHLAEPVAENTGSPR